MTFRGLPVAAGLLAIAGCGKSAAPSRSESTAGVGAETESAAAGGESDSSASDTGAGGAGGSVNTIAKPIPCPGAAPDAIPPEERWPDCAHPEVFADCQDGWCKIPAGCFIMGSPEGEWSGRALYEEDQLAVTLTRSFEIGQHEVTQRQWTARGLTNPSGKQPNGEGDCLEPDCPVGNVTWFEAVAFANLLSEENGIEPCYALHNCTNEPGAPGDWGMFCTNVTIETPTVYDCQGYRLPTDAEWEYAARAGTRTAFYSGNITCYEDMYACNADPALERIGWYCYNARGSTHEVGQLEPNAWGLFDTSGNVIEWNNDRSDGLGAQTPVDPGGEVRGINQNWRGGNIFSRSTICRSASQLEGAWHARGPGLGFRLARTLSGD